MKRSIIHINEKKCNGCGICVNACHEGALRLINGKAKLISESYCDGLGACLPECPTGAISIEEREADAFDEKAVKENMEKVQKAAHAAPQAEHKEPEKLACGCPGTHSKVIERTPVAKPVVSRSQVVNADRTESQLRQWPCQIKLVSPMAPYFKGAHLLVAADCTAYAYANIHEEFMKNKITLIGCPKLDDVDYSEKLGAILANNDIKSLTILRMEVPCCGGIVQAAKNAMLQSGKMIPWNVVVITTDGQIRED